MDLPTRELGRTMRLTRQMDASQYLTGQMDASQYPTHCRESTPSLLSQMQLYSSPTRTKESSLCLFRGESLLRIFSGLSSSQARFPRLVKFLKRLADCVFRVFECFPMDAREGASGLGQFFGTLANFGPKLQFAPFLFKLNARLASSTKSGRRI
jgi:hypothetical protein